jgi:hypothetical protein
VKRIPKIETDRQTLTRLERNFKRGKLETLAVLDRMKKLEKQLARLESKLKKKSN